MVDRISLDGAALRGETIELGGHKYVDFIFGGTTLDDCVLDIRGPSHGFQLFDCTIRNSRVRVRRTLRGCRLTGVLFESCSFEGDFYSCSWGRRPDEEYPHAGASRCDFSAATLDLCSFFDCQPETLKWPDWPNIVILDPWQNRLDWLSINFPPGLRLTQEMIGNAVSLEQCDEVEVLTRATRAEVLNLSDLRYDLDPERIWPLVQDRDYIVFEGKAARPRVHADLAAIDANNALAAEIADRKLRHIRFWNLLSRAKIIGVEHRTPREYRLLVDTSFLREKLPSAPERLLVDLHECEQFLMMVGSKPISQLDKPFTIRGAEWNDDAVKIRAFGKQSITTKYESWRLRHMDETTLDDDKLDETVRTFWAS